MKYDVAWTDLAEDCFPEELMLGENDEARNARIKEKVMKQIQEEKSGGRRSAGKIIRMVALVAALAVLFTMTAYATGLFTMHMDRPEEGTVVSGTWTERNEDGSVEYTQTWSYPDAGFVFTFESETKPHVVKFKPGWLPENEQEHLFGMPDEDGWYGYLSDNGEGKDIPYVISVMYMQAGYTLVLNGECEVVTEGTFGDYQMKEITCRYYPEHINDGNYLLLINEDEGYCLVIGGTNSMEDMEHIAEELEIKVTDELVEFNPDFNIGQINIGRG